MAMGKRKPRQQPLWVATSEIATTSAHPFYQQLNKILDRCRFDHYAEHICRRYYAGNVGRPGLAPGVYFRSLMIGYFEGIGSERGIAWRVQDSLSLRNFLGIGLTEKTPDHSTISRTRRLIAEETHRALFRWVLKRVSEHGLLKGKTVGVDATTLEANAALKSIVRRDSGESYQDYLKGLAEAAGIEDPTTAELARFDRKRKRRTTSNKDWENPNDPEARITKMKDGRTHFAYKAEHAVDMNTGAVVGVVIADGDAGDTKTIVETLAEAGDNMAELTGMKAEADAVGPVKQVHGEGIQEVVTDKGYHSDSVLGKLDQAEVRSYISEPERPGRNWDGKQAEKKRSYANGRRVRGPYGKALLKKRGEHLERSFAHCYETGAMRRVWLRGKSNIAKRVLIHTAAFNLSLILRAMLGAGTPRELSSLYLTLSNEFLRLMTCLERPNGLPAAKRLDDVSFRQQIDNRRWKVGLF